MQEITMFPLLIILLVIPMIAAIVGIAGIAATPGGLAAVIVTAFLLVLTISLFRRARRCAKERENRTGG